MIKLILSDLDGTLNDMQNVKHLQNKISLNNISGIKGLKKCGINFGIVTGNNLKIAKVQTKQISEHVLIYATQNGCCVSYDNNLQYQKYIQQTDYQNLIQFFSIHNLNYVCEDFSNEFIDSNISTTNYQLISKLNYNSNLLLTSTYSLQNISKIQVKCLHNLNFIKNKLQSCFINLHIVQGDNFTIDIMPDHTNKATAIKKIAKLLNLSLNEIAYFGDNENDVSAFKLIDNSFIMSSANKNLHHHAKYVVKDVATGLKLIMASQI